MNADYILVVMHGEIIESGSHQDLIHSKGKYHDLWSKQIFVKPSTDRSRSRSPRKGDANIINDLTPNRQKAELAKVMKTTEHEEPGEQSGAQASEANHTASVDGKNTESGHKREVSAMAE
jgi:hypothetical protein